jgi:hypothetical protein|tara:strand:- start:73 stop:489 length:417 start_codon:yes stop_codon:yes gene_type:complete
MTAVNQNKELKMTNITWNYQTSRIASEISKVFQMAGVEVLKHKPCNLAEGDMYGAFITVNDKNGVETILPISVNKKGVINYNGGPDGWSEFEVLGHLNMSHAEPRNFLNIRSYARTVDFIKYFANLDGFGQDVIFKRS